MFPSRLVSVLGKGALENNYSLDFDGTNDYVDCGTGIGTAFGNSYDGELTVSMWIKAGVTDGDDGFFSITSHSNSNGAIYFRVKSDFIDMRTATATSKIAFTDTGVWHHVTGIFDGANNYQYLYLDGVLVDSDEQTDDMDMDGLKTVIGSYYNTSYGFNGIVDGVAIWNKVLSAGDISALYQARGTSDLNDDGNSANLQGWWRMGDGPLDSFPLIGDEVTPTLGSDVLGGKGDFSDAGYWTTGSGSTVDTSNNELDVVSETTTNFLSKTGILTSGKLHKFTYTVSGYSSGTIRIKCASDPATGQSITANGSYTDYILVNSTDFYFQVISGTANLNLSNLVIKQVNGNPGIMTNMAASDIVKDTP